MINSLLRLLVRYKFVADFIFHTINYALIVLLIMLAFYGLFPGSINKFNPNFSNIYIMCAIVVLYNLIYSCLYHNRPLRAFIYSFIAFGITYAAYFLFSVGLVSLVRLVFIKSNETLGIVLSVLAFVICMYFKNKKNLKKIAIWAGIEVKEDERETKEIKKENDAKNEG